MATKWIPPLPRGWEARYDPNQKAYFFINHAQKTTQWEDPRFPERALPAPPQPQHNMAAATAASLLAGPRSPRVRFEAIGLTDFSSTHRTGYNTEESSLTNEQNKAVIDKLKAEFPSATRELIGDMLRLCHNNERETREQLKDIGFLSSSPGPESAQASPQHHTTSQQQDHSSHHLSPHKKKSKRKSRSHEEEGAPRPVSPARPELSEQDKKRVLNQLKSLYPKQDSDVLHLALVQCHYDLEETKVLLQAFEQSARGNEARNSSAASARAASAGNSAASSRSFSPPAPASLEPAGLEDSAGNRAVVMGSIRQTSDHPGRGPVPKFHTTITVGKTVTHPTGMSTSKIGSVSTKQASSAAAASTVATAHGSRKQTANVPCSQTARAKQVTRGAKTEYVAKPAVVTSQPTAKDRANVTSQFRSEVHGPDASIRKGPDSTLLISDYTQATGPNRSLCSGPDPVRLTGPKGGVGPDLTLRCGPQSSLLHNPSNNAQRLLTTATGGVLVSNI